MEPAFWMVWNELGHQPTFKHDSRESAKAEAQRLAMLHPGHQFHVLQAVGCVRNVSVQWQEYDPIPF